VESLSGKSYEMSMYKHFLEHTPYKHIYYIDYSPNMSISIDMGRPSSTYRNITKNFTNGSTFTYICIPEPFCEWLDTNDNIIPANKLNSLYNLDLFEDAILFRTAFDVLYYLEELPAFCYSTMINYGSEDYPLSYHTYNLGYGEGTVKFSREI